jgi:hypothetical protein
MGQHANQRAWLEFERLDRIKQEQSFEAEPDLTEEEKAAVWDDAYWERLDAVRRYSLPMRHVRVWDEVEVGR